VQIQEKDTIFLKEIKPIIGKMSKNLRFFRILAYNTVLPNKFTLDCKILFSYPNGRIVIFLDIDFVRDESYERAYYDFRFNRGQTPQP
jgi:hypothetical protein